MNDKVGSITQLSDEPANILKKLAAAEVAIFGAEVMAHKESQTRDLQSALRECVKALNELNSIGLDEMTPDVPVWERINDVIEQAERLL